MLEPEGDLEEEEEEDLEEHEEMTVAAEIAATLKDVREMEAQMKLAKEIPLSVVRLPCCAHKVRVTYNNSLCLIISYKTSLQIHLAVEQTVNCRMLSFGTNIKKARGFVIRYRRSPKAKGILYRYFPLRIPGPIEIRW